MNSRILIAIALLALAGALAFAARPHEATADERTDEITTELRCPVCQGLSVKDSTSETARQMRDLVAQRVREGKTDAQIQAEFRAAYGDWIFLSPPVAMAPFYLKGVAPAWVNINDIFRGVLPYMMIVIVSMIMLYTFPQIGLWLPNLIYK